MLNKQKVIKINQTVSDQKLDDNQVLFVRVDSVVQGKKDLIEVPFTHNAYVIKGGGDIRFYRSGTHKVFEDRKEYKKWKKGSSVEVIYIPKEVRVLVRWGTAQRIPYNDPAHNMILSVGANGHFRVSISNPEQFIRVVVGQTKEFDLKKFTENFSSEVRSYFGVEFQSVAGSMALTYEEFEKFRGEISAKVGDDLSAKFSADYGISLVDFTIDNINISQANLETLKLQAQQKESERQTETKRIEQEKIESKAWEKRKYQMDIAHKEKMQELANNKGAINKSTDEEPQLLMTNSAGSDEYQEELEEGAVCPKCGAVNLFSNKHCSKCGNSMF